jgi:uroporphyrinogen decarboxylase
MEAVMVAFTGTQDYVRKYIEPHIVRADLEPAGQWLKPGIYTDVFGVVWNRTIDKNIGVVENVQIAPDTFSRYHFPSALPQECINTCNAILQKAGGQYRLARLNLSLWERAWTLRGMENLMMDLATEPTFAHDLFTRICDYNCKVLARAIKYIECDGIHFGDDWGTQLGLQMSPMMWRIFIKPHLARMYGMVRDAGKFVSIHSCGKVQELFDEFIELGVNSFNPFQPEVIDVDWAMKKYKGRLCFWGGISTQVGLPFGTTQQVYDETHHLIELARSGDLIVCSAHSIPPGTKPENVIAMLEAMRDHSKM